MTTAAHTKEQLEAIEAGRFAVKNPDILHSPAAMRKIIRDLLALIHPDMVSSLDNKRD